MRNHLPFAQEIILCCSILHNIAIKWRAEEPEEDDEEEDYGWDRVAVIDDELDNAIIRARGAMVRDNLRLQMPPPTPSELRRLNL